MSNNKKKKWFIILGLGLILATLTACGNEANTPVSASEITPKQASDLSGTTTDTKSTNPKPTATSKPTKEPKPTPTPKPTNTPRSTATPKPSPTAVPELPCVADSEFVAKYGSFRANDKKIGCVEGTINQVVYALETKGGRILIGFKDSVISARIEKVDKPKFDKTTMEGLVDKKVRLRGVLSYVLNSGYGDGLDIIIQEPTQIEIIR